MIKKSTISDKITLRKINPIEAHEKYKQGIITSIKFEKLAINKVNPLQLTDSNIEGKYYEYVDTSANRRKIFTTNYILFNKEGQIKKELPDDNICYACHQKINKDQGLGIPIDMKIMEDNIIFYTEGLYCSFEHFIHLTMENKYKKYDAEHKTKVMFNLMYPDKKYHLMLMNTPQNDLFPSNDGPLNQREIKSNKHIYINTPGVILYPGKRKFIQC